MSTRIALPASLLVALCALTLATPAPVAFAAGSGELENAIYE